MSEQERRDRRHLQTGRASQGGEAIRLERERVIKEADAEAAKTKAEAEEIKRTAAALADEIALQQKQLATDLEQMARDRAELEKEKRRVDLVRKQNVIGTNARLEATARAENAQRAAKAERDFLEKEKSDFTQKAEALEQATEKQKSAVIALRQALAAIADTLKRAQSGSTSSPSHQHALSEQQRSHLKVVSDDIVDQFDHVLVLAQTTAAARANYNSKLTDLKSREDAITLTQEARDQEWRLVQATVKRAKSLRAMIETIPYDQRSRVMTGILRASIDMSDTAAAPDWANRGRGRE